MKSKIIFLMVVSLLVVANISSQNVEKESKSSKQAKTEIVVCSVNMDCQGCVNKVKNKLTYEKGVKDLYLNLDDGIVAIKFQPSKTDKEKLMETIRKMEYEVTELQSREKLPDNWK